MNTFLRGLIVGAGRAYGAATTVKRAAYRRDLLRVHRSSVPVISVGALTIGGAGKTPVARFIARRLLGDGVRVAMVCGGYRGSRRLEGTLLDRDQAWRAGAAERFGDEAVMLARSEGMRGVPIVCGRDRVAGADLAARAGAQVIVLDDGFQHVRLHRDLDVVLRTDRRVEGPADLLLDRPAALATADLIWGHHRDGRLGRCETDVTSRCVARRLVTADGATVGQAADLRHQRVFLLAGIANPLAFRALVCSTGAEVVGQRWVGDHRPFGARDLRAASRAGADLVLCTEKDIVRASARGLTCLTTELELLGGAEQLGRALRAVAGRRVTC